MTATYERILIVKPSALGDIVLALPALAALHDSFPQAQISWLASPEFIPFLEGHPYLKEVLPFERRKMAHFWRSRASRRILRDLIHDLRVRKFDVAFDFQGLLRSALTCRLSRASQRFGPANGREGAPWFYTRTVRPDAQSMHLVDHYLAMVEAGGGTRPLEPQFLFPPYAVASEQVEQWRTQQGIEAGRYVVMVPGSAHNDKCWPVDRFSVLADRIQKQYQMPVLLVGTQGERATAERMQSLARSPIISLVGSTDLPELVCLMREAGLVISNDTGPGHIAAGLGVPLVMLFSWSNPARIYPYGRTECMVAVEPFARGAAIRSKEPRHNVSNLGLEEVWHCVQEQLALAANAAKDRAVREQSE